VDSYFSGIGYPIPAQTNPAEVILDTVSSDFASSKEEDRVGVIQSAWANSSEAKSLERQVSERVGSTENPVNKASTEEQTRPGTTSITMALLHRSFVKSYRDVIAYGIRIAMYLGTNYHASLKAYRS
jgi:hypothetical protein